MTYHKHLSALAIFVLAGCAVVHDYECTVPGMAAGLNEMTFAERYSLDVVLPIPEDEFLAIVDGLGLKYVALGPAEVMPLPHPRRCPSLDMSDIERGYKIYGGYDSDSERTETYTVFVDKQKRVIYIENRYAYLTAIR